MKRTIQFLLWEKVNQHRVKNSPVTDLIFMRVCPLEIILAALPPQRGGIAQLVERQLCKLDVWGSNPHASTTFKSIAVSLI